MSHGDDQGLVLPPKIAPIQVVILPVILNDSSKSLVLDFCQQVQQLLHTNNFRVKIDLKDERIGEKIFRWEKRGVPIRLEVGLKEIQMQTVVLSRRDNNTKITINLSELVTVVTSLLEEIQDNLRQRIITMNKNKTIEVDSWSEFVAAIEIGNFVLAHWDGTEDTEALIKEKTKATIRCIPFNLEPVPGKCVLTGKDSPQRVLFARAY
jgi:prolyl-tRNA synthetase